jgi:hypothetical protein
MAGKQPEGVQAKDKKSDRVLAFATLGIAVAGIANLIDGKSWQFAGAVSILVFVFVYLIARLARHFSNRRNDSGGGSR